MGHSRSRSRSDDRKKHHNKHDKKSKKDKKEKKEKKKVSREKQIT